MRLSLIIILSLLSTHLFSQRRLNAIEMINKMKKEGGAIIEIKIDETGDTTFHTKMRPVIIYPKRYFKSKRERRRYGRLIRNVKKAYPYAKIAGLKLKILDEQLSKLETEKERKQHLEMAEKEIIDKFEKDIKRLTITQGIILVKLIDRETGRTSYNVIKDLKGGFTAFFWQGIARLFGNNLKLQYDPLGEDKVMEDIVQGIEAGYI